MKKLFFLSIVFFSVSSIAFAQVSKSNKDTVSKQMYTCTMHPDVQSSKPGKCPKCGMTLVPVKRNQAKIYTCPMHPDVIRNEPGKCPKCGMSLVEKKGGHQMDSSMHKVPIHKMDTSRTKKSV